MNSDFGKLGFIASDNIERQNQITEQKTEQAIEIRVNDKALDERLAGIFISSGIPPHIRGYQFLREAVKQAVKNPNMINSITKQLYPAVADKFSTSPSKVERAIRHAIEVAWSRGKIENINNIYGIRVLSKGEKPTNGELIALLSDKMMLEM
ncbi:MAG: sporulation initiation factor Spo0A C-terminal domain-containing protein [Firmicutes bacterium]|nr:sporulation initiation factor Spo0A C-terminal domain-containing protein [Bacillota bacterium]